MKREFTSIAEALPWHSPRCTFCNRRISEIEHARAGFVVVGLDRGDPFVVHAGEESCGFYLRNKSAWDLPVHWFRRAPMEAVIIALRQHDATEASLCAWTEWVSIVLGLPLNQFVCISDLWINNKYADSLQDACGGTARWAQILRDDGKGDQDGGPF